MSKIYVYPVFINNSFQGNSNSSDTFLCMLLNSNSFFNHEHENISELSSNEVSGTGYDEGGKSTTFTLSSDGTGVTFEMSPVEWVNSAFSVKNAATYVSGSGELVNFIELDQEYKTFNSKFALSGSFKFEMI